MARAGRRHKSVSKPGADAYSITDIYLDPDPDPIAFAITIATGSSDQLDGDPRRSSGVSFLEPPNVDRKLPDCWLHG
jgi:hypothetical protein